MTSDTFDWSSPTLDQADQLLIDEYERLGIPLDALAYTPEFKELVHRIGGDENRESVLRTTFLRLLALRKKGVLPRLYHGSSSSSSMD